jgi:hypothetical protein
MSGSDGEHARTAAGIQEPAVPNPGPPPASGRPRAPVSTRGGRSDSGQQTRGRWWGRTAPHQYPRPTTSATVEMPGSHRRELACRAGRHRAGRSGSLALTAPAGMDLSTSMSDQPAALRHWHAVVTSKNPALLDDLLADEVVFRSPAVFAPISPIPDAVAGIIFVGSYVSASQAWPAIPRPSRRSRSGRPGSWTSRSSTRILPGTCSIAESGESRSQVNPYPGKHHGSFGN